MERLSGLDASFLYLETPNLQMHVCMAVVFDPSTAPGGFHFGRLRDLVAARLELAPVFRRRLVQVPLGLGHPYWIDDPDFDLDYHLRRAALPTPGGVAELADFVGDICGRQLDRSRPLWQMFLVEGVAEDHVAVVTKVHHAAIDGVSGAELLGQLFDLEPLAPPEHSASPARRPPPPPPEVAVVARAMADRMTRPVELIKLAWRTGRAVHDLLRVRRSRAPGTGRGALPLTAPRTSLNAAVTPHRSVALASVSLDDVKVVKRAVGCTVNDVVLALCTTALREYLAGRGELPVEPLVAMVPVSVEPPRAQEMRGSNKISAMWVGLPCAVEDPLERLEHIQESTKGAKEEHRALGADLLVNWTEHASPNVFSAAARVYSRLGLADHHRPLHSLVISNVPGPDFPLYLAGAQMVAGFPLGPVIDGAGLNMTVMSYRGVLNWGLMACRETVPGVWDIAAAIPAALDELLGALGHASGSGAPSRRASPGELAVPVGSGSGQRPGESGGNRRGGAARGDDARDGTVRDVVEGLS